MTLSSLEKKITAAHAANRAEVYATMDTVLPYTSTSSSRPAALDAEVARRDGASEAALATESTRALYRAGHQKDEVDRVFRTAAGQAEFSAQWWKLARKEGWTGMHMGEHKVIGECAMPPHPQAERVLAQELAREATITAGPIYLQHPRLVARLVCIAPEAWARPTPTHIEIYLIRDNMPESMLSRVVYQAPTLEEELAAK